MRPEVKLDIREIVLGSRPDEVRQILEYPKHGELAADVAEFVGFGDEALSDLRRKGAVSMADLDDRERDFVADVGSIMAAYLMGSERIGVREGESWSAAIAREREQILARWKRRRRYAKNILKRFASFEKSLKSMKATLKEGDQNWNSDAIAAIDEIEKLVAKIETHAVFEAVGSKVTDVAITQMFKDAKKKTPASGRGGRPGEWHKHHLLVIEALRLAIREQAAISRPEPGLDWDEIPSDPFHEFLARLEVTLKLITYEEQDRVHANLGRKPKRKDGISWKTLAALAFEYHKKNLTDLSLIS